MDFPLNSKGWFFAAGEFAESVAHSSNFPYSYAYGVFLALSGHLIGRRAFIRYATPLYANHYVALVGPSGLVHKSTAVSLGLESLGSLRSLVTTLPSVDSVQGLLKALDDNGPIMLVLDELSTLAHRNKQDYAAGLIARITELYGCPPRVGNYTLHTRIEVNEPFLSLVGNSTIEWLKTTLTAHDLMGGFGNRMTWVLGDPRPVNPWPKDPIYEGLDWPSLLKFEGQAHLDEQAEDVWRSYYFQFSERQRASIPFIRVLAERIPEKVLKCALVMCAWRKTLLIDEEMLCRAITWGDYLYECIEALAPSFENVERQVLACIENGHTTKRRLFGALSHEIPVKDIRLALDNLKWLGYIKQSEDTYTLYQPSDGPHSGTGKK